MYNFLNIFFLIVFTTTIKAQTYHGGQCPNSTDFVQANFDPSKFAGIWYEIKTTLRLNPWEALQKCVVFDFSKEREGVIQVVKSLVGKITKKETYKEITFIPQYPGSYDVENGWHYAVVYSDYEKYAILGACNDITGDGLLGYFGKASVLARKKKLSLDEQSELEKIIKNVKFPMDNLQDTTQDCG